MATRTRRRNPDELEAAAAMSEAFHGRPAHQVREYSEVERERTSFTELGRLVEIELQAPNGKRYSLPFGREVRLASTPDGGQLAIFGGDQAVNVADLGLADAMPKDYLVLGTMTRVVYNTRKGFHNFEQLNYQHDLGEVSGLQPVLCYDALNEKLFIVGGNYQVRPEGIVD